MRLLVSEYVSGGGLCAESLPQGLMREGMMMWRTLVQECLQISAVELTTTLDSRLNGDLDNVHVKQLTAVDDYAEVLTHAAQDVDFVWLIAPESNNVLGELSSRIQGTGAQWIGSDLETIHIASNKRLSNERLQMHGIAVIPILSGEEIARFTSPLVVKKVDGVSCEGMRLLENGEQAEKLALDPKSWIVQPYVPGEHLSLSLLCMNGNARVLTCNRQHLTIEEAFVFTGCTVNAQAVTAKMEQLAQKIAKALPGLEAYVGVDLIISEGEIYVVDVNPRLSTSYVGLARARGINIAELCIQAKMEKQLPEFEFRSDVPVEVNLDN